MTRVCMAVLAAAELMGQQRYEQDVLRAVTDLGTDGLVVDRVTFRSMRSALPGDRRLPLGTSMPARLAARVASSWIYPNTDVVHRCDLRLPAARRPEVVTVHDLAFRHFDDEAVVGPDALDTARNSRVVLTPSAFVADEIRALLPRADVRVAPNGVPHDAFNTDALTTADRAALALPDSPYVLHSGGATRRKNLAGLAAAWPRIAAACPDVHLVLTGPSDSRRTALFTGLPRTLLVGRLPRDLQLRLMRSAAVVVVPSTYEGFGLPALEAMAAGVPVVATDGSSLTEVVGDAGLLVEPSAAALADGVQRVLEDPTLAGRLAAAGPARAAGFTWATSAAEHVRAYTDAARA